MKTYILRRLMLMPLTLLGVTSLVFCITFFVPGGPVEQMMQQQTMSAMSGQKSGSQQGDTNLSEDDMERLEEQFGMQEHMLVAYLQWLGMMPRKVEISKQEFKPEAEGYVSSGGDEKSDVYAAPSSLLHARVLLVESGREIVVTRAAADAPEVDKAFFADSPATSAASEGWSVMIESPRHRADRWAARIREKDAGVIADKANTYAWRAIAYQTRFSGLLQGSLGNSFKYNEPVWDMMAERIPVSLYFGLLSAIITYSVSIPLGVLKAIKHKTLTDNVTSVLIFVGYSVPGFALGAVLVVYLGARLEWFPLYGLTSPDFAAMPFLSQVADLAHHTVLPLLCYVVSTFAVTTMMMKNNLMDNLSADYVRTAMAKGVGFRAAVFRHAFRNSFIPIASTLGGLISMVIAGSMLIERVFDIQGFGILSYQALMDKDYSLIMGTLLLTSFLMVLGNLLSDIIVATVDPRVKFE